MGPEANTSAAPSLARSAPVADKEKGPGESGVRPNTLAGLLDSADLLEDHRTVLGKISSATSGINEAFRSLLKGFEVSRIFELSHTRYMRSV